VVEVLLNVKRGNKRAKRQEDQQPKGRFRRLQGQTYSQDGGTMSTFSARLHLPGRIRLPLRVEVDIQQERMTLISDDQKVATWLLDDLDLITEPDGFHITVNGEELVLIVKDPTRFAAALRITEHTRRVSLFTRRSRGGESRTGQDDLPGLERRILETWGSLRPTW
jgi:hypothetical protein